MKSETAHEHQKKSSKDISCGIITLSDSRKSEKLDLSGKLMAEEIEKRYTLKSKSLLLSRATAGIYKKTIIFSMPGSPNAVKTALSLIIDELPHFVHHVKKWWN